MVPLQVATLTIQREFLKYEHRESVHHCYMNITFHKLMSYTNFQACEWICSS